MAGRDRGWVGEWRSRSHPRLVIVNGKDGARDALPVFAHSAGSNFHITPRTTHPRADPRSPELTCQEAEGIWPKPPRASQGSTCRGASEQCHSKPKLSSPTPPMLSTEDGAGLPPPPPPAHRRPPPPRCRTSQAGERKPKLQTATRQEDKRSQKQPTPLNILGRAAAWGGRADARAAAGPPLPAVASCFFFFFLRRGGMEGAGLGCWDPYPPTHAATHSRSRLTAGEPAPAGASSSAWPLGLAFPVGVSLEPAPPACVAHPPHFPAKGGAWVGEWVGVSSPSPFL